MSAAGSEPVLQCSAIVKRFGSSTALDDVDLDVRPGEVHALMGENGAGKSTLVKIIAGQQPMDGGEIRSGGELAQIAGPWDAAALGFGFVHQHAALVDTLSIAENLGLAGGYSRRGRMFVDWDAEGRLARSVLERLMVRRSPSTLVSELSIAEKQMIAMGRALRNGARLIVLDEITAPLVNTEIETLFSIVRNLTADGVGFIYVSHRIPEVFSLADRVTVLRDGRRVACHAISEVVPKQIVTEMIGHEPRSVQSVPVSREEAPVVKIRGLQAGPATGFDLDVRKGEIVGLAGLAGSGRTSILESVFGVHGRPEGDISIDDELVDIRDVRAAIAEGVGLVTEDRGKSGFAPEFTVRATATLPWARRLRKRGWLGRRSENRLAESVIDRLDVRPARGTAVMRDLSGGNQQKVIVGRWLEYPLRLLLLDEPTHGVDVGAKEKIYALLLELASQGLPMIVASSEFEELEALCSRVVLLDHGTAIGTLEGDDVTVGGMLGALLTSRTSEQAAA